MISLPLRYEADFLDGASKDTKDTFKIDQANVPFRLNDEWAICSMSALRRSRAGLGRALVLCRNPPHQGLAAR
jgi:hypothetical protein